jgi:hypothetical protein
MNDREAAYFAKSQPTRNASNFGVLARIIHDREPLLTRAFKKPLESSGVKDRRAA